MHGQNMACDATGNSASCSPLPLLHGLGSMLQASSAYSPLEAVLSEQTFARPQRLPSFEGHPGGVNAPVLSLRRYSKPFLRPVRYEAPVLGLLFAHRGAITAPHPLPDSRPETPKHPFTSAPLQDFRSFGIVALSDGKVWDSLLLRSARFPFAPRGRVTFYHSPSTDHRSRSAPVRQAHCSLNLLEPGPSCRKIP